MPDLATLDDLLVSDDLREDIGTLLDANPLLVRDLLVSAVARIAEQNADIRQQVRYTTFIEGQYGIPETEAWAEFKEFEARHA